MILKSWKCFINILTKGVEENMELNSISALLSLLPGNNQLGQTTCPMKMDDIPAFHKWKQIFSTAIALFPQVASVIKQFILHWQDNLVFYKSFDVIKTKSSKAEGLCSLAPWLYGKESVLNCINSPNWQNPNWWYISHLHIVKRTIACHHRLCVLVWQGRATENNSVACLI